MKINKAVIPAAGLGTRFLPATKAVPKEMLPIVDVPMIQHIVEEAVQAGVKNIVLITARGKEAIENHFDYHYELEEISEMRGKDDLKLLSRSIADLCTLISIRQKSPLGLGHAVLCAAPAIGDEPFAVLLGDELIDAEVPCTEQLAEVYFKYGKSVVGVMEVPDTEVSKYGIIGGKTIAPGLVQVERVVEKPQLRDAPSRLAIPGRYVLSPEIFSILEKTAPGRLGEIQLPDGLAELARRGKLLAYQFKGKRYDTGDHVGYIDATLSFALRRQDLRERVRELILSYAKEL